MPGWLTSWWTFVVALAVAAFGLWRLFRSFGRWRPQQGSDPQAQQAELRVRMASKRTLEGGA